MNLSMRILLNKLYPVNPLNSVAITGTNGKTSVSWYVAQFCLFNKIPTKTFGTLGYYINNKKKEHTLLTTPNYEILHQAAFSKKKNKYNFIFEASSHAIDQGRLKGFPINVAAITNISQDHLDYHKTIKNYQKVKFDLFIKYLDPKSFSVLNDNIGNIDLLKKKIKNKEKIISYGQYNSDINLLTDKKNTVIKYFNKRYILKSITYKKIDLENIACAIACCYCLNIGIIKILKTIKSIKNPPGRSENVINDKGYKVIIDYAHTPDALKNILLSQTLNKVKPNILFGCGGERDKIKRSKMGCIAKKYAKKIYITDDNPREEDPSFIRRSILHSCNKAMEISGRKKAIFYAVGDLRKNEVLIIAGKGHEKFQIINKLKKKFDDMKIAKLALENK